jgi:sugar O-acyltransferase (sialic acid O-acetyltransferase NeuD family)
MKLLIAGAGGHGRVVADAAQSGGAFTDIAFLDDRYPQLERSGEWPVVGRLRDLPTQAAAYGSCIAAFGDPNLRLKVLDDAAALGFVLPVVLHPSAILGLGVRLGAGTVVLAGAIVNIGAVIGRGAIVNTGAVVEHDCSLGDGVHVCPGACIAGEVSVGRCSWIGIGASIIQCVTIGADVTVGAGGVCIRDVGDGQVVVGVPAKEIHK